MPKDTVRFAIADGAVPASLEVRIRPGRLGGWEAVALMHRLGDPAPTPLGRVFRASDRWLTADKMVAWVRRRYRDARPLAERAPRPPHAA